MWGGSGSGDGLQSWEQREYGVCVCMWEGEGESWRERDRERERENTSGLLENVFFFVLILAYFVSCNGPCALKEKWHRKEHIIDYYYY